ncbi:MAG: glycosyl hydrolase family 57, partial [Pseudomonadota bacterium]
SLIENLNALESSGASAWSGWAQSYAGAQALDTALGNRRLDLVAFGYHHPLMPLLDEQDIRMQIRLHRHVYGETWNTAYSRGMFPPETAFSTRMIPALVAEGIDWVLVDNIHFDRASQGYPHNPAAGLYPPNRADQVNPDPSLNGGAWVQLQNLWAPSRVSAPFGYQPHFAQHVDPATGDISRMVVVPAARYEGNEDGRGGYGAFLYDQVMDAYLPYNTDPDHPMFVVLHHDGDNFGGGSEAYYHGNFQNMVAWASSDPDYDVTTVADYLDRFPPDPMDVIHVEDGAWAGADNGDPQFKKWLGDPDGGGVSPDIHSWAVLTAVKNRVFMAEDVQPIGSLQNVLDGTGSDTERAWHYLLVSQASDYWYWDGSPEPWDGNVTRGANLAVAHADDVIDGAPDRIGPTVFMPQRDPYNPGGYEFGSAPEPSDFEVWTLVDDVSAVASVTLKYRVDLDGENSLATVDNETYAGGPGVGAWQSVTMT